MQRTLKSLKKGDGFTMVEVITVLLIIGIIAVVAVVRLSSTSTYDLTSQVEVLKVHLRLAQARAMSAGSPWGICFSSPTTYYLFEGAGSTTPVIIPGENSSTVDLTAKKSALTVNSTGSIPRVTFDKYGSPGSANLTIITGGGDITITKNTGFIP
jgi:MSHA pilin protein MshC